MSYSHSTIENLLNQFSPVLGADHAKYKNHIYRVFLNCLLADSDKNNEEKYAIAAVFHDIGIWTHDTIDYLNPSIEQAKLFLRETCKQDRTEEITGMIYWHHKTTKYKGRYEKTIETFRKADWTDVSLGLKKFGIDKQKIKLNRKQFPNRGFHWFLVKRITKNFFHHPLHPLPMFKNKAPAAPL